VYNIKSSRLGVGVVYDPPRACQSSQPLGGRHQALPHRLGLGHAG
jgi:hypothetical protein